MELILTGEETINPGISAVRIAFCEKHETTGIRPLIRLGAKIIVSGRYKSIYCLMHYINISASFLLSFSKWFCTIRYGPYLVLPRDVHMHTLI